MSTAIALALGVLRFFGALVVGILLLIILSLFASQVGLARYLFLRGYVLILILALRLAITGNATRFDRAAGAVAAALTATGLVVISIVAASALTIIAGLSFFSLFAMMGTTLIRFASELAPVSTGQSA